MKLKSSLFLSIALASSAFAFMFPGPAMSVSDNGQFVAGWDTGVPNSNYAYVFDTTTSAWYQPSDTGATASGGIYVDDAARTAGWISYSPTSGWMNNCQAAVWSKTGSSYSFTNLHSLVTGVTSTTASMAVDVNTAGWVVGHATNGAGDAQNAALWSASGVYTNLNSTVVGATASISRAINDSNTIAGQADIGGVASVGVWKTANGLGTDYVFTNLHSLAIQAGTTAIATTIRAVGGTSISDNGSVIGEANFGAGLVAGCWLTSDGTNYSYRDLHSQIQGAVATNSQAISIDSSATRVVGAATISGQNHASLWDLTTNAFSDLNAIYESQLASNGFSLLTDAIDISDSGKEIVGAGIGTDGKEYGFLIKDGILYNLGNSNVIVPEPASSVLLGLAGMSFLIRRKRK